MHICVLLDGGNVYLMRKMNGGNLRQTFQLTKLILSSNLSVKTHVKSFTSFQFILPFRIQIEDFSKCVATCVAQRFPKKASQTHTSNSAKNTFENLEN